MAKKRNPAIIYRALPLSLVAILLSGCTSIATNVALINVLATERSLEPEKPKKLKRQATHAAKASGVTARRDAQQFQDRFGQWKKTKLELWGPA